MSVDLGISESTVMSAVGVFITFILLILRLIARHKQKSGYGMDDYLAFLAWFIYLGVNVVSIYALIQETYETVTPSIPANYTLFNSYEDNIQKAVFGGILCNIAAVGCGRISAVLFYRRIFCTVKHDMFDILTKIIISILLLWTVGFLLSTLLACGTDIIVNATGQLTNNQEIYDSRNCIIHNNQNALAISSVILDFLVLILPLPKIWTLHTTLARKIAVSGVFLVAVISLIASCLRVVIVFQVESAFINSSLNGSSVIPKQSYFYQLLETAACLVAINMPSIWYFFHRSKSERSRWVGAVSSSPSTGSRESTDKSNPGLPKNESIFSDGESVRTRRTKLELIPGFTFSQLEINLENDYRV